MILGAKIFDKYKKYLAVLMIMLLLYSVALPFADGFNQGNLGMIGSNSALGSPLLGDSFVVEEWNKWELIAFGVFLSNFVVPLVDDYQSAFTQGHGLGSNGSGLQALQFGSGNDPSNNQILVELLNYVVMNQDKALKPIFIRQSKSDGSLSGSANNDEAAVETSDGEDSTVEIDITQTDLESATLNKMFSMFNSAHDAPQLTVAATHTGATQHVVFDMLNPWNQQMMLAWFGHAFNGTQGSESRANFNAMTKGEDNLYLDTFGNIVSHTDGRYIMVIPAAMNPHITEHEQYNMLNSVLFGGSYISASPDVVKAVAKEGSGSSNGPLDGSNSTYGMGNGRVAVVFDSKSIAFNRASGQNVDNLGNVSAVINGNVINDVMRSTFASNQTNDVRFNIVTVNGHSINTTGALGTFWNSITGKVNFGSFATKVVNSQHTNSIDATIPKLDYIRIKGDRFNLFSDPVVTSVSHGNSAGKERSVRAYIDSIHKNYYLTSGSSAGSSESAASMRNQLISHSDVNGVTQWLKHDEFSTLRSQNGVEASDISNSVVNRMVKIYPQNNVMNIVSSVLGVKPGTDFALYSTSIYSTYLEYYGVLGGKDTSNFKTALFDGNSDILNFDIEKATQGIFLTEEQKKREISNLVYLMLHPTHGKEYRANIIYSNMAGWLHKTYQNIVYGRSTNVTSTGTSGLATRSSAGFLHVPSYSDNFMVKWFIDQYAKYLIYIIGIGCIVTIVVGILTKKNFMWFLGSLIIIINVAILMPTLGETVPYMANRSVQNMFHSRATYWSIHESLQNSKIEADVNKRTSANIAMSDGLSPEEAQQIAGLARMLNIVYLDRALMLRYDISKKVTESEVGNLAEIQTMQSARWMLPMIIRQFTASDMSANYIFTPLSDAFMSVSNLYWVYFPEDKTSVSTAVDSGNSSMAGITGSVTTDNFHKMYYRIPNFSLPTMQIDGSFTNGKWEEFVESNKNNYAHVYNTTSSRLEARAGTYNSWYLETVYPDFGFLWATENPLHHFYGVIKSHDEFKTNMSMGSIAGTLQGDITVRDNGQVVRSSFMHDQDGNIKDIVNLEDLMTEMIPYLYKTQILAGGFDGISGALGDSKIESYRLYQDNYKSWMFRSNWVTKLMESKQLTSPTIVKDKYGNEFMVSNPMLPQTYPENRKMVFSESQMVEQGLSKNDLNLVELKCIDINNNTERKWTLMLNYVNADGMTREIMIRQMALDAMLIFNSEFSNSLGINPALAMHPTTVELRSVTFDSVLRMLMLNTTRDSRYIYGDLMMNLVENSDIFTAVLLLIGAFLASYIMPLSVSVTTGLLFYLGFWAVLTNILSAGRTKLKIAAAFVVNNLWFLIITLAYFQLYKLMMGVTYQEDILNVKTATISVGTPVWIFIIIIAASSGYIYLCYRLCRFAIINFRDLGFQVYAAWAGMLSNKISSGLSSATDKIADSVGKGGSSVGGSASISGRLTLDKEEEAEERKRRKKAKKDDDIESGYVTEEVEEQYENGYIEIDSEIEKGKTMED